MAEPQACLTVYVTHDDIRKAFTTNTKVKPQCYSLLYCDLRHLLLLKLIIKQSQHTCDFANVHLTLIETTELDKFKKASIYEIFLSVPF